LLDNATDSAHIAQERTAYRRHPLRMPRSTDRALERRPGGAEIREREPQARESLPARAPRASSIAPTAEATVRYAALSVRERGHASEAALNAVKTQLIEIVQHVALNTWTNAINAAFRTQVDFLVIATRQRPAKTAQRPSAKSAGEISVFLGAGCNRTDPGPVSAVMRQRQAMTWQDSGVPVCAG
jgi:hypothetical protein